MTQNEDLKLRGEWVPTQGGPSGVLQPLTRAAIRCPGAASHTSEPPQPALCPGTSLPEASSSALTLLHPTYPWGWRYPQSTAPSTPTPEPRAAWPKGPDEVPHSGVICCLLTMVARQRPAFTAYGQVVSSVSKAPAIHLPFSRFLLPKLSI